MRELAFEFMYRIIYTFCLCTLLYCFSYFNQGLQHDYFSGVFSNHYQAVDFNSYENACREITRILDINSNHQTVGNQLHHQSGCYGSLYKIKRELSCFSKYICGSYLEDKDEDLLKHFISTCEQCKKSFIDYASQNESKSWSYLFLSCLTYFYCLQFKIAYACEFSVRNLLSYVLLFFYIQLNALLIPGLLKKQRNYLYLAAELIFTIILVPLLNNQSIFFGLVNIEDELLLEPLDSELQIQKKVSS